MFEPEHLFVIKYGIIDFFLILMISKQQQKQTNKQTNALVLPTTTVYLMGFGSLYTQWAAVTIQLGLISVPPHMW